MSKQSLQYAVIGLSCLMLAGAGLLIGLNSRVTKPTESGANTLPSKDIQAIKGPNIGDDRILMGVSDNVFVGKVIQKVGEERINPKVLNSQYTVQVVMNVKGNLQNSVIVSQYEATFYPLLQVGSTYVFAVRYNDRGNEYLIASYPEHYTLMSQDVSLGIAHLNTVADSNERVKELQGAYPQEVPFDFKIQNHIDYNSYASRCLDASGELIDDTVELSKEKQGLTRAQCVTPLASQQPPATP